MYLCYSTIKVYRGVEFKGQKYTYSPLFNVVTLEDSLELFSNALVT
ncbi:hypothetical protein WPG_1487 [Winogradskyella sp. PG-2]|nr:hypothetical protein WPG_1487 [Winogradskyella sp. PG-2]